MLSNATTIGPQTQTTADAMFDAVFERSHHFRMQLEHDAAIQFIRRIKRYNDFEHANVIDALKYIDKLIPRKFYGEGNPNNGERRYTLSVGREGSPVVYLEWYEWKADDFLSDQTLELIKKEMELIGEADESDYEIHDFGGSRKIVFRFWWD